MEPMLIAAGLALGVYGGINALVVWLVGRYAPEHKLPGLFLIVLLIVGLFVAIEICNTIVDNTALRALDWGQAGENYVFPFLVACTLVVLASMLVFQKQRKMRKDATSGG